MSGTVTSQAVSSLWPMAGEWFHPAACLSHHADWFFDCWWQTELTWLPLICCRSLSLLFLLFFCLHHLPPEPKMESHIIQGWDHMKSSQEFILVGLPNNIGHLYDVICCWLLVTVWTLFVLHAVYFVFTVLYFSFYFHCLIADLVVLLCVLSSLALWAADMSQ